MRKLFFRLRLVSGLLAGCTASPPVGPGSDSPPTPSTGETITVDMVAQKFEFIPGTITANQGDTVILNITSTDVEHGISIPEFGVNTTIPAGQTVTVEFVADQAGTFPFSCSVFCGGGHGNMKGTLIVNP